MALDYAKPGDIIVVDGAGYTDRALVGGMMLAYAQERNLGGFVVNGAVRDLDDIKTALCQSLQKLSHHLDHTEMVQEKSMYQLSAEDRLSCLEIF